MGTKAISRWLVVALLLLFHERSHRLHIFSGNVDREAVSLGSGVAWSHEEEEAAKVRLRMEGIWPEVT